MDTTESSAAGEAKHELEPEEDPEKEEPKTEEPEKEEPEKTESSFELPKMPGLGSAMSLFGGESDDEDKDNEKDVKPTAGSFFGSAGGLFGDEEKNPDENNTEDSAKSDLEEGLGKLKFW